MALKNFIKNGEQFIYLRRYKTELDSALATFWDDLQAHGYFEDNELKVKKSKMLTTFTCDGEICGYAVPLSTANILKSTAFPKVKYIIFDEFILDASAGTYRYLKREPEMLLDIIETVFRLRDDGRVLLLGNFINFFGCPYVGYFELDLPYNSDIRTFKDGAIVVQTIKNPEYQAVKSKTRFGRLIEGTVYGDYAIGNQSLRENTAFIGKRPAKCKFYAWLVLNGNNFGVWSGIDGYLYISEKYDPSSVRDCPSRRRAVYRRMDCLRSPRDTEKCRIQHALSAGAQHRHAAGQFSSFRSGRAPSNSRQQHLCTLTPHRAARSGKFFRPAFAESGNDRLSAHR